MSPPDRTAAEQAAINARVAKALATKAQTAALKRAATITEALAKAPHCHCQIPLDITDEQLRDLGAGCTAGQWVCPTLATIRRRLTA